MNHLEPTLRELIEKVIAPFLREVDAEPDRVFSLRISARKGRITGFQKQVDCPYDQG